MREGFVEKVRSIAHHLFKVLLGLPSMLPSGFKFLLCTPEFILHALETLHGTAVWRHLVKLAIKRPNFLKQLFLEFVIGLLLKSVQFQNHK